MIAKMNTEDWFRVPNYPHQPPHYTDKQAMAPHWKRLKDAPEALRAPLRTVIAATVGDALYKIDGHSRAQVWQSGYLPSPKSVIVMVYRVATQEQLIALYSTVHGGARQFYENVVIAYEEAGIRVQSKRLKHGFIVEAMNIAIRGATRNAQDKRVLREELNIRQAVAAFKAEIESIDAIGPRPDVFVTGVLAAALLMLALDPKRITFFEKLAKQQGNTRDGRRDPIESLLRYLDKTRSLRANQGKVQADICQRTVRAVLAWEAGEDNTAYWLKQTIRGEPLAPFLRELRRIKKIR